MMLVTHATILPSVDDAIVTTAHRKDRGFVSAAVTLFSDRVRPRRNEPPLAGDAGTGRRRTLRGARERLASGILDHAHADLRRPIASNRSPTP
jgi:hypothetical protein